MPRHRPAALALLLALLPPLACTAGGDGGAGGADEARPRLGSAIPCAPPGDSVIVVAVREYLQGLQPTPRRFLVMLGSDSTLPDAGRRALQERGPMYLYPADPAQQGAARDRLSREFGSLRTLLVLYGGMTQPNDQSVVVRLSGRVVGGSDDGQRTPARAMHFSCQTARWRFARAEEERQA